MPTKKRVTISAIALGLKAPASVKTEYVARLSRNAGRRPMRSATAPIHIAPKNIPRKLDPSTAGSVAWLSPNDFVSTVPSVPARNTSKISKNSPSPMITVIRRWRALTGAASNSSPAVIRIA
jgi:hypothetical protein